MQLSSENARRSRFCDVTYSSACQRVTRFTRFPTFALPATAATSGRASGATSAATVSGFKLRIGVETHDEIVGGALDAEIERGGFAAVRFGETVTRGSPPNARIGGAVCVVR